MNIEASANIPRSTVPDDEKERQKNLGRKINHLIYSQFPFHFSVVEPAESIWIQCRPTQHLTF
jgi:hypothetical protein